MCLKWNKIEGLAIINLLQIICCRGEERHNIYMSKYKNMNKDKDTNKDKDMIMDKHFVIL